VAGRELRRANASADSRTTPVGVKGVTGAVLAGFFVSDHDGVVGRVSKS